MRAESLKLSILASIKVRCGRTLNRSKIPHYAYTRPYRQTKNMKHIIYILTISFLIFSCDNTETDKATTRNQETVRTKKDSIDSIDSNTPETIICDLSYDTIKNAKYNLHIGILDILLKKHPRNQLRDQDIHVFMVNLDPTEKGIYRHLTNKVTFALLEKGTKSIIEYFSILDRSEKINTIPKNNFDSLIINHYNYFFEHVGNPICNTLSTDSIALLLKQNIEQPSKFEKQKAKFLIEQLNTTTR